MIGKIIKGVGKVGEKIWGGDSKESALPEPVDNTPIFFLGFGFLAVITLIAIFKN